MYETIRFRIQNYLINLKKKNVMMGPHLPSILALTECSNKGCRNLCDRMCKPNNELLTSVHNKWTMRLNVDIAFAIVQNSFVTCRRTTPYIFSILIDFKVVHNRVMTNTILHNMKLVDDPNCFYCGREESLIHAFLECENVTNSC